MRPLRPDPHGVVQPVSWHEVISELCARLAAARVSKPHGVRFLLSAHASHEELFLFQRIAEEWGGGAIDVTWRYQPKSQPKGTRFKVPPVDAPNVNGARLFGLAPGKVGDAVREADLAALKAAVEAGEVPALYVFDPGPDGSLGPVDWIIDARKRGTLPLLIVQGVLATTLSRAADLVLPGASYVEKEASYTNGLGRLQGTARAISPPGDAMEDWEILVRVGTALGVALDYTSAADVRADIAGRFGGAGLSGIAALTFGRTPLAPGIESLRAVEMGFHVPGPATCEGRGRPDGPALAAGSNSTQRGEIGFWASGFGLQASGKGHQGSNLRG